MKLFLLSGSLQLLLLVVAISVRVVLLYRETRLQLFRYLRSVRLLQLRTRLEGRGGCKT